jgi:hypothetical protein
VLALTLTQPWASLVACGAKNWETRSWSTNYRGPLAIHAAAGLAPIHGMAGLRRWLRRHPEAARLLSAAEELPRGAILATCRLVDVIPTSCVMPARLPKLEWMLGDYTPGRFAWRLEDVEALAEPISCAGRLGLWTPSMPIPGRDAA